MLSAFSSYSQTISSKAITLSVQQAAKIQDSLRVLPTVRQEANAWHQASTLYKGAADSLQRALSAQQNIGRSYQQSLADQQKLLTSATAEATEWRSKARKRGVVNVLLVALAGGLLVLAITH